MLLMVPISVKLQDNNTMTRENPIDLGIFLVNSLSEASLAN